MTYDDVNHPKHYASHPSGVECVDLAEHLGFNLGNALKYVWRAGKKDVKKTHEDLEKALWYIERERRFRSIRFRSVVERRDELVEIVRFLAMKVLDHEVKGTALHAFLEALLGPESHRNALMDIRADLQRRLAPNV